MAFKWIVERFLESGGQTRPLSPPGREPPSWEDITAVKTFFSNNKKAHLAEAIREMVMSVGKIWLILRKVLKWKAYKPHACHILTQAQMGAHRQWLSCSRQKERISSPRRLCGEMKNTLF